ncbi:MAG: radical SAM family heme chaperone HemW [Bacteroidales bacterium]|nr:radical SAM family heme chaperone HemW [Bacteroidales bacterium]
MAGIYYHIPFCRQKCYYCNFYVLASNKYKDVYTDALLREMELRKDYLEGQRVDTLYFGGGTPSSLPVNEIVTILKRTHELFEVNPEAEITLEANPEDLTPEYLQELKQYTPVNRFSIGIQSFFDDDLEYLHRNHDGAKARKVLENAKKAGFNNLNMDLIYGIPTLTEEKWKQNLEIFFSYELPHLSSYALTVEPKTTLEVLIDQKKRQNTDDSQQANHFEILLEQTGAHGYMHYEISNFAKPGHYSKHNSIYWMGGHYLGLGPSAHSFNGISRQWNVQNMKLYTESDTVEKIVMEKEILTPEQRYNEYVMTSLRTNWGCDLEHIRNGLGEKFVNYFLKQVQKPIQKELIVQKGNTFLITHKGKFFSDGIASDLFMLVS